ncbi:MAG: GNAT family N-acetyltransferase [Alphaproteobacteria bacterium]|nr:GNAT family N-acetyltransferase [Alphaproteobacteria bacterium]
MSSTILQFALLSSSESSARKIRDLAGLPASLGFVGPLEIRLAQTKKDIRKVQRLRYKVFYEQGSARADARASLTRRDICPYDRYCDHLLIIDHAHRNRFGQTKPKVVGTYRLLRQDILPQSLSLYSAQEFDLAPLLARHANKRFLELGRSCVLPDYRGKRTIELLWRGIWTYVKHHRIDVMIGCASFDTIKPQTISLPLNFLHQTALAQDEWQVHAHAKRAIAAGRSDVSDQHFKPEQIRQALQALPPLIKGYLRVGARFGSGAVVDYQFGTTDVLVIMPIKDIDPRYIDHFDTAVTRPCAA